MWEDLPGKEKVLPNGKKIKITAEGGVIEQHPSHTVNGKWTTSITRPASRGKGGGGRIQKYRENP